MELLAYENKTKEQYDFRNEFRKLRGDFGVGKFLAEEILEPNKEKLLKDIKSSSKPKDTSHLFFIS